MNKIKVKVKVSQDGLISFAQGPQGEILYIAANPAIENKDRSDSDVKKFIERKQYILEDDHHLKFPDEYKLIQEVDADEASLIMGLPKLTHMDLAKHDLRRGIKAVSEGAIRDIKG